MSRRLIEKHLCLVEFASEMRVPDGTILDEIDTHPLKELLQVLQKSKVGIRMFFGRHHLELDGKIEVAALGVKSARHSGPKERQSPHSVARAECHQLVQLFRDRVVHCFPRSAVVFGVVLC